MLDRFDLIVLLALCSLRSLVMVEIQMVTMTKMKDTTKDASCSGNNEFDEADDFIILIFLAPDCSTGSLFMNIDIWPSSRW